MAGYSYSVYLPPDLSLTSLYVNTLQGVLPVCSYNSTLLFSDISRSERKSFSASPVRSLLHTSTKCTALSVSVSTIVRPLRSPGRSCTTSVDLTDAVVMDVFGRVDYVTVDAAYITRGVGLMPLCYLCYFTGMLTRLHLCWSRVVWVTLYSVNMAK